MPEKLQTLLFIALGLIVFVVRLVVKARETARREAQERGLARPDQVRPEAMRPVRPPGAPSFDELLQQMMEQNRRGPAPAAEPKPAREARPARSLETAPADRSLEAPRTPARSLEAPATARPARSLETPAYSRPARSQETMPPTLRRASELPRVSVAHGHEDFWSRQTANRTPPTPTAAEVAARLRNPTDVRTAFILAEVLQRRF
ncbi:hypothetical protein [Hymenobacter sp. B81]|uniref:hypothetical protein n=1 Tax=Hymenobacter sp. B81 TaxID=3344878 RepID=UPI0037DD605D